MDTGGNITYWSKQHVSFNVDKPLKHIYYCQNPWKMLLANKKEVTLFFGKV
jgi:hypothetical protein